jgi:hypothetical protein
MPVSSVGSDVDLRLRPIIYVRGFAGTENEIEETVADPYMGFNLGATKYRQNHQGTVRRHYFESPLVRLGKDFGYSDVYTDGVYMPLDRPLPARPIVIYRYYDGQFYDELSDDEDDGLAEIKPKRSREENEVVGKRRDIEDFAAGLGKLILRLRKRYEASPHVPAELKTDFKVHLVGHSMGGLIIRSFLQFVGTGGTDVRKRYTAAWEKKFIAAKSCVDKVFTYATPHNGIELEILENVPSFFTAGDADNFNRRRMAEYLALPKWSVDGGQIGNLLGKFPTERFFTLVGTNHQDYAVLYGWSQRLVGPMSDGLVRITNATLHSQATAAADTQQCPRAFVHRSHSGPFGIVNSEEGYQNLARFLFGDVRVDCQLELDAVTLPTPLAAELAAGQTVRASYNTECTVTIRGMGVEFHRRAVSDGSASFREYDDLVGNNGKEKRIQHLFSLYLRSKSRIKEHDPSLGFGMTLGIKVPEYVIERKLWLDRHFEGGDLLSEAYHFTATPPDATATPPRSDWSVKWGSAKTEKEIGVPDQTAALTTDGETVQFSIPIDTTDRTPGVKGTLRFTARPHR